MTNCQHNSNWILTRLWDGFLFGDWLEIRCQDCGHFTKCNATLVIEGVITATHIRQSWGQDTTDSSLKMPTLTHAKKLFDGTPFYCETSEITTIHEVK